MIQIRNKIERIKENANEYFFIKNAIGNLSFGVNFFLFFPLALMRCIIG